jgi:adenylate cyclase class 1
VLLKMLLDAPQERLICHQFREAVYAQKPGEPFPDCGIFATEAIFKAYKGKKKNLLQFIKECFYLRCDIKFYDRKSNIKTKLAADFYRQHPLDREIIFKLEKADSWDFKDQIDFGNRLLYHLHQIYREIAGAHSDIASESDRRDLTILGRKISAFYLKKKSKVSILPKPLGKLNVAVLSLDLNNDLWSVFSGNDTQSALISDHNVVFTIAFIVWNNLFAPNLIRMRPNPSNVTHQEIVNLGIKMKAFLGSYDTNDIDIANYLREEYIVKLLVVAGFERSPWEKEITDYSTVHANCWGELFVQRFGSTASLKSFLAKALQENPNIEINKYLKRDFTSYEKTIARSKAFVFPSIKTPSGT